MPKLTPKRKKIETALLILMICGWIIMLFIESSGPSAEIISLQPGLDKVAHFFAFGILGLMLCTLSFRLHTKPFIPILSMPFLIVCIAGFLEESYQMTVSGRTASLVDFSADVLGVVFAIVIANRITFINPYYHNRDSQPPST